MADYEHVSDAEKLKLAQHFLLSSPPGEIRDVAKDVTKLLPPGLLSDAVLRGAQHSYNVDNFLTVDLPNGESHRLVVCKEAEIDNGHYVDTKGRKVWGFDHIKQETIPGDVQEAPSAAFSTALEAARESVQAAVDSYLATQFANQGGAAVFATDSALTVVVSAERVSLRNYWTGRWKSKWTVTNVSGNSATVAGRIDLHVHYFEDGNLQLQSHKDVVARSVQGSNVGAAVVDAIREEEHVVHSSLEDMYINMSEETFKEMRRVMPVTQTKMDWSIHAHRTAKDLGRK
ncbi:Aste57867_13211 [Aphanomyces stellatus]|uniref:F-actin-capping protein subunit alpha n=1 Tax=Aphanomyces stellatus TaxID=120398 RepID=A0A485KXU4_9STRA|nr:hypothetical protein As57867_013162 [Aphanomyces stellatus]VFT90051.1 Aste57867_13211 [Aphanomyces stellatus]